MKQKLIFSKKCEVINFEISLREKKISSVTSLNTKIAEHDKLALKSVDIYSI